MLRGEKVTLRPLERDDLKTLHALHAANVDLVLLADGEWSPESLMAREKQFDKGLDEEDASRFAIEADGKVIGSVGLHPWHGHRAGNVSLGIGIYDPAYLGKGYGRDALNVFLDWCFRIQNYRRVGLSTGANNERALRAYRACGFIEEGRRRQHEYVNGEYEDEVILGLLRRDWEARQPAPAASPAT
jgi:RimJ/RimL family protein N-acetyltransferase